MSTAQTNPSQRKRIEGVLHNQPDAAWRTGCDRLDALLNAASHGVAVLGAMCLVAALVVLLGHWGIFGRTQ